MRLVYFLLASWAAACGAPPVSTPVVVIASGTAAPATASPLPLAIAPAAAPAAPPAAALPRSFFIRSASTRYDLRLDMKEACPGEAPASIGCAGPAALHVLTKTGAEIQRVDLDQAWVEMGADGEPLVNATGLYDSQGTINVGDFDFDGHEDFAVQVDQSGPYGGPTFAVFLHAAGEERFVRSEALSRLTQETLGFFQVVPKTKRLVTLQKSGCCFHVLEEHEVVRGEPRVVLRVTEDATGSDGHVRRIEERLVGGRWRRTERRIAAPP
jgi:hypothetical protein